MAYLNITGMQAYPKPADPEEITEQAVRNMPLVDMLERLEPVLFAALDKVIDCQEIQDDLIETLYDLAEQSDMEAGR